jgi:hypothetical protein
MPQDDRTKYTRVAENAAELIEERMKMAQPIGLDVGTSKIAVARRAGSNVNFDRRLNAFLSVPYLRRTERILSEHGIDKIADDEDESRAHNLLVYGDKCLDFADVFNADVRRPMAEGLLNPREKDAQRVVKALLGALLPPAGGAEDVVAYSVPAAIDGKESELNFHQEALGRLLREVGYKPVPINEGLSVIFSELQQENFTGIGISCGGGMCNVAVAYLSIPSLMFSVPKGGDYIDRAVGAVTNETATRVKVIKEESLDLDRAEVDPRSKMEEALFVYYKDLVETLVESLLVKLRQAEKPSRTALPVVLAGGTAMPKGFKNLFEKALKRHDLPVAIGGIRMATRPLEATARGALIAAEYEK